MVSDARAQQAREHHRAQLAAEQVAMDRREQRDRLVRMLRAEDPQRWTYRNLAKAVGCTPELIAAIVQGRVGRPRSFRSLD